MRKTPHRILFLLFILGLGASACSPIMKSTVFEQTSTNAAEIVTSTPRIIPTVMVVNSQINPVEIPKGTMIQFWHPWSGEMANLMADMTDEFNQTNEWGIIVEAEFHSDDLVFMEDMNQAIADGNPPELIAAPDYYLRTLDENGLNLQNLQNFIDSQDWGFSEDELKSFVPLFWKMDNQSEKRIGIPAYQSGQFIFLNKTWAKELGFSDQLVSPDDFKELVCEAGSFYLNDGDLSNNGTGGWIYTYDPNSFFSWMQAFSAGNRTDTEFSTDLGNPTDIESGTYLYDLFLNNCSWIGRQQQPYEYFANRQALAYSGRMEDILIQERVNALDKSTDQWSVFPYPAKSGEPILLVDGDAYAITTRDAEKALAAWVFVRWLLNPGNQVRIVEISGTFPLSNLAIELLSDYKNAHPVWTDAFNYLPLAQKVPEDPNWGLTKEVLADLSWKLIQYNSKLEDVPVIFQDAQKLLNEITK